MSKENKIIYVLFIQELNLCKIGISQNVEKRVNQLQTGCPYQIKIIKKIQTGMASKIEKVLHRMFSSYKIDYTDYNLTGEWFNLEINKLLEIDIICQKIENDILFLKENKNPFLR